MGKSGKRNVSKTAAVLKGVVCATAICLAGLIGLTQMIILEKAGEKGAQILVLLLLALSSVIGCLAAIHRYENHSMICIAATVSSLILIMLLPGLIMEGSFENVLPNVGSLVTGGCVSCVLCLKKSGRSRARKSAYR